MVVWAPLADAGLRCACAEFDSPVGPLAVAVTPVGLLALAFGGVERAKAASGRLPDLVAYPLDEQVERVRDELREYFAGRLRDFTVPIDWRLSAGFAQRALRKLAASVGYGQTVSYVGLSRRLVTHGESAFDAARAVGRAMAGNPVAVVVPCHRVIASDGNLHGFGGGLEAKRRLLALEGVLPQTLDDLLALD